MGSIVYKYLYLCFGSTAPYYTILRNTRKKKKQCQLFSEQLLEIKKKMLCGKHQMQSCNSIAVNSTCFPFLKKKKTETSELYKKISIIINCSSR